jgi:hypothetical protein
MLSGFISNLEHLIFAVGIARQLKIAVEKTYPLTEVKTALSAAQQEQRGGKILLDLR